MSFPILENFTVYFGLQTVPSLSVIALLGDILSFAESIPDGISQHAIATITVLLGKSRKNQEKYRDNIAGLLELMVSVSTKSPLSAKRYSEIMQLIPQVDS